MRAMNLVAGLLLLLMLGMGLAGAANAADKYGAIAYSQNARFYGWAKDFNTQRAAEAAALNRCRERVSGCKVTTWFRNACGALSVGNDGGWGSHWGVNLRAAEASATRTCHGVSRNCRVIVSLCVSSLPNPGKIVKAKPSQRKEVVKAKKRVEKKRVEKPRVEKVKKIKKLKPKPAEVKPDFAAKPLGGAE
jgi:hypothetical protein